MGENNNSQKPKLKYNLQWSHRYIRSMELYDTKTKYYLIGKYHNEKTYRVIKIDRTQPTSLSVVEDSTDYTEENIKNLLHALSLINKTSGGIKKVLKAYLIIGFIRFLFGYYMILATKKKCVGHIGKHEIFTIDETRMIYIPHSLYQSQITSDEEHYKNIFREMDLTKDFYFSYTYDITNTLQINMSKVPHVHRKLETLNDMFMWNHFLIHPLISSLQQDSYLWVFPIIYGSIVHRKIDTLGRNLHLILIGRRSRLFAGARFLKRGLNEQGYVANDVETEQIMFDSGLGKYSDLTFTSFVQHRGSIPLYWAQINHGVMPKPPIVVQRVDPFYRATILHFMDLYKRYGNPIIVLNLIKSKETNPREMILRDAFSKAIEQINSTIPDEKIKLIYIGWDFKKAAKINKSKLQRDMYAIAQITLNKVGFFHSGKPLYVNKCNESEMDLEVGGIPYSEKSDKDEEAYGRFQCGTIRTNCIDSLDRTNAAQYLVGLCSLSHQLHAMGIIQNPTDIAFDSEISLLLLEMYEISGHQLAIQYGGSGLAHTINTFGAKSIVEHSKDLWTVVQRYYRNAFTDQDKQNSINLFLGIFQPYKESVHLWELETDYPYHMKNLERELLYVEKWWEEPLKKFFSFINPQTNEDLEENQSYNGKKELKLVFFDKLFSSRHLLIKCVPVGNAEILKKNSSSFFPLIGIRRWISTSREEPKYNYYTRSATADKEFFIPSPPYNPLAQYGMTLHVSKFSNKVYNNYADKSRLDHRIKKKRVRYSYYTKYYRMTHYRFPNLYKSTTEVLTTPEKDGIYSLSVKESDLSIYDKYISTYVM